MDDDVQFSCTACHIPVEKKDKKTMTACRLCGRLHCSSCVDEHGQCVACREEKSTQ